MNSRRQFIKLAALGAASLPIARVFGRGGNLQSAVQRPLVLSTWDIGVAANKRAWEILNAGGKALDAVEQGVMVTESSIQCCVGLAGYPDRDGHVTLDACIMDENANCGGVAFLSQIEHPISVARAVMEKTPHVLLVGEGAQQFAIERGFKKVPSKLSADAERAYKDWLKHNDYKPVINIENKKGEHGPFAPLRFNDGTLNHDTIGMIAIDAAGNLSGAVTTSGLAFKMHGRVGDSPIIGAGLFVDNEVGAAASTGVGEEVIRSCGTHTVVELMRLGRTPFEACKEATMRIVNKRSIKVNDKQVGFLAINKQGKYGAFAIQKGFNYAVCSNEIANVLKDSESRY